MNPMSHVIVIPILEFPGLKKRSELNTIFFCYTSFGYTRGFVEIFVIPRLVTLANLPYFLLYLILLYLL